MILKRAGFSAVPILKICFIFLLFHLHSSLGSAQTTLSIPVLCYHKVLPNAKEMFAVSTANFREQLSFLKARQYTPIDSNQLFEILTKKISPYPKPVVITFDDGFKSVLDYAFPIMKEFDFVGVVCVYPQFLNTSGALSWGNLAFLASQGWTVESHSFSHANLSNFPKNLVARKAFFEKEIHYSRKVLEEKMGMPIRFMVWPYGIYTEEAEQFARDCGYKAAMTVDGGTNYPGLEPFRVKRQVIYGKDTLEKFAIRVEMKPLETLNPTPRPGEVVSSFSQSVCWLPSLVGQDPRNFVFNYKVTGGLMDFSFDPSTQKIHGRLKGKIKNGSHFIDVYLRDKRTGQTAQNGWYFLIQN